MPSRRRSPLPPDWTTRRHRVFTRDDWTCVRCSHHDPIGKTLECDHIGNPSDHSLENLQTLCTRCHREKTAHQANAARRAKYNRKRKPEPHPGLIRNASDA